VTSSWSFILQLILNALEILRMLQLGLPARWKWDLHYLGILRCENPERAQI